MRTPEELQKIQKHINEIDKLFEEEAPAAELFSQRTARLRITDYNKGLITKEILIRDLQALCWDNFKIMKLFGKKL